MGSKGSGPKERSGIRTKKVFIPLTLCSYRVI